MFHKSISNIAQICALKGIKRAIISPGSRNAPLSISFYRHPKIECITINDERSAAFIGVGMALTSGLPTVLICTSGSAAYNYAPAIAEAYFQHSPLLVLTADRPPEWIDQLDGQTIRQNGIYGEHVKKSYQAPISLEHKDAEWHLYRLVSEAINSSSSYPQGPVHINIPFREPFYPGTDPIEYSEELKIIESPVPKYISEEWNNQELLESWQKLSGKLIIAGQGLMDSELIKIVDQVSKKHSIPIISDVISNFHAASKAIRHQDLFLTSENNFLKPDLILSFGKSVISKNLKLFLRDNPPIEHWHIQPGGDSADTFQALTKTIYTEPKRFFKSLEESFPVITNPIDSKWIEEDYKASNYIKGFIDKEELNEMMAINRVLLAIDKPVNLHLANSMSVRYVNYLGITDPNIEVFCNRGTSGIDGSTSTALGAALNTPDKTNLLITGDMAFFYDRNALWNPYLPDNLKILLINNHAGLIFGNIPGPSQLPKNELEAIFEGHQPLTAELTAKEFGLKYALCKTIHKLDGHVHDFLSSNGPSILEIETDKSLNKTFFKAFKESFKS